MGTQETHQARWRAQSGGLCVFWGEGVGNTGCPRIGNTSCVSKCANARSNAGFWSSTRTGTEHPRAGATLKSAAASQVSVQGSLDSQQELSQQYISGQPGEVHREASRGSAEPWHDEAGYRGSGSKVQSSIPSQWWEVMTGSQSLGH